MGASGLGAFDSRRFGNFVSNNELNLKVAKIVIYTEIAEKGSYVYYCIEYLVWLKQVTKIAVFRFSTQIK